MFRPRPYQELAYDAILRELWTLGRRSTLLVMATGLGKTIVFGMVARHVIEDLGGRVLVLAHRGELLQQALGKFHRLGIESVIEKGDQDAREAIDDARNSIIAPRSIRCVVGSVQTFHPNRITRWDRDYFDLIVVDEAHHAPATTYTRILSHFGRAKVLGVTATADRLDGENLGGVFESKAAEHNLDWAISEGWLSPIDWRKSSVQVDLRGIKTTAGDFNVGQLEDRISKNIEPLVNGTAEIVGDRRAIVFTPDVGSAKAFSEGLRRIGRTSRSVDGKSTDRADAIGGFEAGDFQFLCNCMLLNEGADFPFVEAVVLARPTQSRGLVTQMVGRGTRLFDGKDNCRVVDFSWLCDRHKLVEPVSLISPDADERTAGMVQQLLSLGLTDLRAARDRAEQIRQARESESERESLARSRAGLRLDVRERNSGISWVQVNPIATATEAIGLHHEESWASRRVPATGKQIETLVKFKVPESEARLMSRSAASRHLDWLISRREKGLSSLPQVMTLVKNGVEREYALSLTFEAASERLDRIIGRRLTA